MCKITDMLQWMLYGVVIQVFVAMVAIGWHEGYVILVYWFYFPAIRLYEIFWPVKIVISEDICMLITLCIYALPFGVIGSIYTSHRREKARLKQQLHIEALRKRMQTQSSHAEASLELPMAEGVNKSYHFVQPWSKNRFRENAPGQKAGWKKPPNILIGFAASCLALGINGVCRFTEALPYYLLLALPVLFVSDVVRCCRHVFEANEKMAMLSIIGLVLLAVLLYFYYSGVMAMIHPVSLEW